MVKLTIEMITKQAPGQNKRRPDESVTHYLNRLTHIYYQDKSIDEVVSEFFVVYFIFYKINLIFKNHL